MANEVKEWATGPTEMKLRAKYRSRKAGNVGSKKGGNSGGVGKKALATKRCRVVSQRSSPEQWIRFKSWAESVNLPVLG